MAKGKRPGATKKIRVFSIVRPEGQQRRRRRCLNRIRNHLVKKMRQTACKPGSVLRPKAQGWPFLWDGSCLPPRATYPDGYPETDDVPSLFGLAPGGACHAVPVARSAVRSYRTISTLPVYALAGFAAVNLY